MLQIQYRVVVVVGCRHANLNDNLIEAVVGGQDWKTGGKGKASYLGFNRFDVI